MDITGFLWQSSFVIMSFLLVNAAISWFLAKRGMGTFSINMKGSVSNIIFFIGAYLIVSGFIKWYGGPTIEKDSFTSVVQQKEQKQEPLYTEVDFLDDEKLSEEQITKVEVPHAAFTFSNHGGMIRELIFIRQDDTLNQYFNTVAFDTRTTNRETGMFLVALENKTPFIYKLIDQRETDAYKAITYEAATSEGVIKKDFLIYKNTHQCDLVVTVSPRHKSIMRPRIIWTSPFMESLQADNQIAGIFYNRSESFKKKLITAINFQAGYFSPRMFGSENKYFVHALVSDQNHFGERAYYKQIDHLLLSFVEAKAVDKETSWTLSFYLGPKDSVIMNAVDERLDVTLNYGYSSIIAKMMLKILKWLFNYLHNYGWAIVILTILLKLLLLPFSFQSTKKMKGMEEFQRKSAYIKQQYKDDPQALKLAQAELVKKYGMPGLIGGCLPMLLQLPFFWGLSGALNNSIELYHAPFLWMRDLSLPDPWYVFPLCMMVMMLGSVFMTANNKTGATKNVMTALMMVFFSTLLFSFSSGMMIFITVNMLLHLVQTYAQKALEA